MRYKEFGKTQKKLSVIGFGGMRFQKEGEEYDIDRCADLILEGNKLGINYFDTAPFYCDDKSQLIFGKAIKKMPNKFFISTKSGDLKGDNLRRELEKSLKILGLEKINFYQIWCVMDLEDYRERSKKGGAIEAALKAKNEGLIEHLCISTHAMGEEIEVIANEGIFEGMTLGFNILNFKFRENGIRACHKNNMGIVTMNPLGGGIIPQNQDKLDFIKTDPNEDIIETAIKFNLSTKGINVALVGINNYDNLLKACKIGNEFKEIESGKMEIIKENIKESLNELCTGCRYCEYCPEGISVSKYMYAYNQKILGNKNNAINTIKWHWRIEMDELNKCVSCGLCEKKCTQHLEILKRFEEMKSW
ncbi:MAG: aldo/keto reductase [Clostridiales bacterium]